MNSYIVKLLCAYIVLVCWKESIHLSNQRTILLLLPIAADRTRRTMTSNGTFDNESAGIPASESIHDHNEDIDYDFLEERANSEYQYHDCSLTDVEFNKHFSAPPTQKWRDLSSDSHPAVFKMDDSKDIQWKLAKKEIEHVKYRTRKLLSKSENEIVTPEEIAMHSLGPESPSGKYMMLELELDEKVYLQFMITFLIQAAYRVSTTELFRRDSLLVDQVPMDHEHYVSIWEKISTLREVPQSYIRTTRSSPPLWERLETITNEVLSAVSITDRIGKVSIALDDDKIWFASRATKTKDLFNLKFTTHVKANRKGIVAHTAVSTGALIPLAIVFERTKDSCLDCMKKVLDFMFGHAGEADLRNVSIHSDRGYMYPDMVFGYLLSQGAEVVGTCQRMAQCWPFTFKQKRKEHDKRTHIDVNGAPTLFLKYCKAGTKHVFASAFRNGTQGVATAVSTLHRSHEWEGVVLKPPEHFAYKADPTSLREKFFQQVMLKELCRDDNFSATPLLQRHLDEKIEPITLRQGKLYIYIIENRTSS